MVGGGGEGIGEYRSNGAGTGNYLQDGSIDGADLREWELCSDGWDSEGAGGVPPSSGSEYYRDVSLTSLVGGMVVVIGCGGLGGGESVANKRLH